jgi:hypothetical protein
MPLQSLFSVHNELHVSLLSIHVAPSAALALFVLALVFLYLYLPPFTSFRWRFWSFGRKKVRSQRDSRITPIYEESEETDEEDEYARRTNTRGGG